MNENTMKMYQSTLRSTLKAYCAVHYAHLENDVCWQIYPNVDENKEEIKFTELLQKRIANQEYPAEDVEMIRGFFHIENIKKGLSRQSSIEFRHPFRSEGSEEYTWHLTTFIANEYENEEPVSIIIMTRCIEELLIKEDEQRRVLEDALAMAHQANNAKSFFLSNMSHDIRTPMNAIVGFTALAKTHVNEPERVKRYLEKITSSSNHLLSLINDILDMSYIESGRLNIVEREEDIIMIVEEVYTMIQPQAEAKGITFVVDTSGVSNRFVFCDKLRMKQILVNLCSNAVKYTACGGNVTATVKQKKRKISGYYKYDFYVKDNGKGMSKAFMERMFEPFEREEDHTTNEVQGTGLGLAIVKNIVDMMNGMIDVHSQEGKGSEFVVTIPLRVGENIRTRMIQNTNMEEVFGDTALQILLVEDNRMNQELAKEMLEEEGMSVDCADNGAKALEKLLYHAPEYYDIVLMDIQMPVMDGYEATQHIRSLHDSTLANIPIVAMTANAFYSDKQKALKAGMNDHIAKPINIASLLETMQRLTQVRA